MKRLNEYQLTLICGMFLGALLVLSISAFLTARSSESYFALGTKNNPMYVKVVD